jgi:hypothetical protein
MDCQEYADWKADVHLGTPRHPNSREIKMKRITKKKKLAVVVLAGAMLFAGAGVAFAYFTSTGSGSGTASVGTSTAWGVTLTSDGTNTLLPGSGSEVLDYVITNNGAGVQALTAVTAAVANSGAGGACLGTWFTAVASAPTPLAIGANIPAGGTTSGTVTVTMQNFPTVQDACKSLTTIPVTLNAA